MNQAFPDHVSIMKMEKKRLNTSGLAQTVVSSLW